MVVLFSICQLPRLFVRTTILLLQLSPDVKLKEDMVQTATNVASGLLVVNATANFFIYCLVGTSFRRSLIRLCSRRPANNSSVTTERRDELLLTRNPKPSKAGDQT